MVIQLYLNSIYIPNYNTYKPLYDEWLVLRDQLREKGSDEVVNEAREKVDEYADKMGERGYFHDDDVALDFLKCLDLRWCHDVIPTMGRERLLQVNDAHILLRLLRERKSRFETYLQSEVDLNSTIQEYFREKYRKLKLLLEEAITLKESIVCSLS